MRGTNIVCLGCNGSTASAAFASSINLSSIAGTFNEQTINDPADITSFLTGGTVTGLNLANTGIIYMNSGFNVSGGINDAQVAAVNAQGTALNNFIIDGGGLFAQSQATNTNGFGWLTSLLPGLVIETSIADDSILQLTAAGNAAFPGLTDVEASNGTPWHNWFSGDFGNLDVLVTGNGNGVGGFNDAVVLGGGAGGAIICGQPNTPPCPTDGRPRAHHDGASRIRPGRRSGCASSGASRPASNPASILFDAKTARHSERSFFCADLGALKPFLCKKRLEGFKDFGNYAYRCRHRLGFHLGFQRELSLREGLISLGKVVSRLGIEPRTRRLRVCCSAN